MTESYHFQIEPEPAKEALFRVGGVYLDGYGGANYVQSITIDGRFLWVRSWSEGQWDKSKFRHLANGKFECMPDKDSQHHLLPGEVALRGDGKWAPASIAFPSGSVVLTDGNQITGRIEPEAKPASMTPTLDKLEATAEPKRPPLDWNTSTPFDTFGPGFKVRSDTGWMTGEDGHPLQRMTADSPTHGSAHLLAKP